MVIETYIVYMREGDNIALTRTNEADNVMGLPWLLIDDSYPQVSIVLTEDTVLAIEGQLPSDNHGNIRT